MREKVRNKWELESRAARRNAVLEHPDDETFSRLHPKSFHRQHRQRRRRTSQTWFFFFPSACLVLFLCLSPPVCFPPFRAASEPRRPRRSRVSDSKNAVLANRNSSLVEEKRRLFLKIK